jgi:Beta-galactosidase
MAPRRLSRREFLIAGAGIAGAGAAAGVAIALRGPAKSTIPRPSATASPVLTPGGPVKIASFTTAGSDPRQKVAQVEGATSGGDVGLMSWILTWAELEPEPLQYNWALVENCLDAASATGRRSILRVNAGEGSPTWYTAQYPSVTFAVIPGGPERVHCITMPIPWSTEFLTIWSQWIAAYGKRYNGDPRIFLVEESACGRLGEMGLGSWNDGAGGSGWESNAPPPPPSSCPPGAGGGCGSSPLTPGRVTAAWNQMIDAYRKAFPKTPTALNIGYPLLHGNAYQAVPGDVISHAQQYGTAQWFQQNGRVPSTPWTTVLHDLSATTTIGWQMGPFTGLKNPVGHHTAAVDAAFKSHASYVEAYQADLLDATFAAQFHRLAAGGP